MKTLLIANDESGVKALKTMLKSFNGREKFKFLRQGIRLFLTVVNEKPYTLDYNLAMFASIPLTSVINPNAYKIKQTALIYEKCKVYGVTPQNVTVQIE